MTSPNRLIPPPPPWHVDADGALRIRGTRVALSTVIGAFHAGASAEEIVLAYPTLSLTDVYAAIAYYLWHRSEIDALLQAERTESASLRKEIEAEMPARDIRARLLARQKSA